ncbi:MAG TPA: hypothetical protein PLL10_01235 [Elusimicrobiales bacterium]|nr:hypothetical protein [Elusimicrobiales bacterium]
MKIPNRALLLSRLEKISQSAQSIPPIPAQAAAPVVILPEKASHKVFM